jgi:gliding motility-associated-like protein
LIGAKTSILIACLLHFTCPAFCQAKSDKQLNSGNTQHAAADTLVCKHLPADFKLEFSTCDQHLVSFENNSLDASVVAWDFGDGASDNANDSTAHAYNAEGVYKVTLVVLNQNGCYDTVSKDFLLTIDKGNIFSSKDLNVCKGIAFQMPGDSDANKNCWSPAIYLNTAEIANPTCTPFADTSYTYNIIKRGINLIANGNFSSGNTGFSSEYIFNDIINTSGHYFVGPKPTQWNRLYENCFMETDTTNLGDTMMIVNGSTKKNVAVWDSTLNVTPNTNYNLIFFAQPLTTTDSLVLQVSINDSEVIGRMRLSRTACNRSRFLTSWYSAENTTVNIKITDLDTGSVNNSFALDSISLRSIYLKTDSIHISLKPFPVFSIDPPSSVICPGDSVTLVASGGDKYVWNPAETVTRPGDSATAVFPLANTTYKIVITESTCKITDSVFADVIVKPKPTITVDKSNDVNCAELQSTLNATGGVVYYWWPENTLSNPQIANPVATPHETTTYHVRVTSENGCFAEDSVQVKVLANEGRNNFLLPTAFTPNNDGVNDYFGIRQWGNVTGLKFFIYDQWGHRVFYTGNASIAWNGTFNNKLQPPGTYVYYLEGDTVCGHVVRKGTVVLIR